jgi:biopolymer transport protein ExbD
MAIKKKSKVSAQFNMSSLTDIIFLLLIFFMLTSSMIIPNALNLQLPGKGRPAPPSSAKSTVVKVESNGKVYYNGNSISISGLDKQVRQLKRSKGKNANITLSPSRNAKNEKVVQVLDICYRHGVGTVLDEPR